MKLSNLEQREIKSRLLNGEEIEFESEKDWMILFTGHNGFFCIMLNSKVIKSVKTFKSFIDKVAELMEFRSLCEKIEI